MQAIAVYASDGIPTDISIKIHIAPRQADRVGLQVAAEGRVVVAEVVVVEAGECRFALAGESGRVVGVRVGGQQVRAAEGFGLPVPDHLRGAAAAAAATAARPQHPLRRAQVIRFDVEQAKTALAVRRQLREGLAVQIDGGRDQGGSRLLPASWA